MMGHRSSGLLLAAILLTLTACGSVDFSGHLATSRRPVLRDNIHRQMEAENFRAALEMIQQEVKRGLPEAAMAEEYGLALNGVLDQAERFRGRDQLAKAGELFRSAHQGFPEEEAVAKRIKLTPSEILVRIEDCTGQLMERGLTAYRAGDLDGAIKIWKMILAFNPQHAAALKNLKTAEIQRANLLKVSSDMKR